MVTFAEMEHNFSVLTVRMCKVETYVASASSVQDPRLDRGSYLDR